MAERAVEALGPIFQGQPWPQFSIFSRWSRVQILGHACKLSVGILNHVMFLLNYFFPHKDRGYVTNRFHVAVRLFTNMESLRSDDGDMQREHQKGK